MINRRLQLLKHWFAGRRNQVGLLELLANVLAPTSYWKSKTEIDSLTEDGDYWKLILRKISSPLYWHSSLGKNFIYQVVSELVFPQEWHYYETAETAVKSEDIVVDCGAAEGLFSLLAAPRTKQVYVVEPLPLFVDSLKKTFENFSNVEIIPVALDSEPGLARINEKDICSTISKDGSGSSIVLETIDNLFYNKNKPITYLKADLEGFERQMLLGAVKTLKEYRPKIAITTYHRENDHLFIAEFLKSLDVGYQIKFRGIEERWGQPVMIHAWVE